MIRFFFTTAFVFLTICSLAQTTIYLFPGQGADERLFSELKFDSTYRVVNVAYPRPEKKETISSFAEKLLRQIDTTKPFVLIGTSLGGMLCVELAHGIHPEKTIIISSAKNWSELPFRYRFQRSIPLYAIIPKALVKGGARMLQPIVEPDRKKHKAVFTSMLKSKDKRYMKRSVRMIIRWDRAECTAPVVAIHGTNDHTLQIRFVHPDVIVEGGSHMMTLTRSAEINALILELLKTTDQAE